LNVQKTKTMAFYCSNPPVFCYNGTPLENVQEFKYLDTTLSHNGECRDKRRLFIEAVVSGQAVHACTHLKKEYRRQCRRAKRRHSKYQRAVIRLNKTKNPALEKTFVSNIESSPRA